MTAQDTLLCLAGIMSTLDIPEGQVTATIYQVIKESKWTDGIALLQEYRQSFPQSRAALSLLAYCLYQKCDFTAAAECYEELATLFPDVDCYQLYHAQALFKACDYEPAMESTLKVNKDKMHFEVTKLQAAIKFAMDDLPGARAIVETCEPDDADTAVNQACIMFAEGRFDEACQKFSDALLASKYRADLAYNIALCHYRMKRYTDALRHITDIVDRGMRAHQDLQVGWRTEGIEVRSVGNTQLLKDTALIEAFNLKAAIEYKLKQYAVAQEALTDMPPRSDEELDPVTLHNVALMNMDTDANGGFDRLQFLLQQNPCPPETFGNLLLLYIKYEHYDLAADVLAENSVLTYKLLSQYLYDFLDATITKQTSNEEAYKKLDNMATELIESLRKLSQKGKDPGLDDEKYRENASEYDDILEQYVPVLMAQAKIYWDLENYQGVESVFRKSMDLIVDHDVLGLNIAHVLFMQAVVAQPQDQDTKYREAISFYEPIVSKHYDKILDISPIVLANLCVSYIMRAQNDQAEEIMGKIEKEEEALAYSDPTRKVYHHCIVNLVIGTLYCAKGNFQFGITRVIKSIEPMDKKLGSQTWFYIRSCFCALIEGMAKNLVIDLVDSVADDIIDFLEACELHGRSISTVEDLPLNQEAFDVGKHTVTYEARVLKHLFQELL